MRWGHITPIGASEALLLPKTDLPNLSVLALAGLVYSTRRHELNPIHTQPPVQNKAIARPLKRCG